MSDVDNVHVKTYRDLDVSVLQDVGNELRCSCSFCAGTKMYVNKQEGFFDCKNCGKSGNKYTFMKYYYEEKLLATDRKKYVGLSGQRNNIPPEVFEREKLAYVRGGEWLIPVYSKHNALVNLRRWNPKTNKMMMISGCSATIFGEHLLSKYDNIVITEGEWDAIALRWLLHENRIDDVGVVAVPGCATFKETWSPMFAGKTVTFAYDNDEPGQKGFNKALTILNKYGKPKSTNVLRWPDGLAQGYDVRDFITQSSGNMEDCLDRFNNLIKPISVQELKEADKIVRTSFEEVLKDYEQVICMNDDIRNGLLLLFSIVLSNRMQDVPLWLFLVGPSGGGKTMTLQSVADMEDAVFVSKMTSKALVSGYIGEEGDPSLLPKLIGKTLVLKEFTEILNLPGSEQEEIFDTLRGAYDGRVEKPFGNGVTKIYPIPGSPHKTCHFGIVAGVTSVIHGKNRAALGERFLRYQMFQEDIDHTDILEAAVSSIISGKVPEDELKRSAAAFLTYMKNKEFILPTVPRSMQVKLIALAQIVGHIRAFVERNAKGDLVYRPVAEVGTRLAKQFTKLLMIIGFTLQKTEVDYDCYKLVKRVALDTAYSWNRDVFLQIASSTSGITAKEIMEATKIKSRNTVDDSLENLHELNVVVYETKIDGTAGKPAKYWKLAPKMVKLVDEADLFGDDFMLNLMKKSEIVEQSHRRQYNEKVKLTV